MRRLLAVLLLAACSDSTAPRATLPLQYMGLVKAGGSVSIPIPAYLEPQGMACWTRTDDQSADLTNHDHKPLDGQFCGLFGEPGGYLAVMTQAVEGKHYLIVVH